MKTRIQALGVAALLVVTAIGHAQTPLISLAVAGRSNATPWIAASGRFVAVAWGASAADGATDVFMATSRDGGQSFSDPKRVNAVEGEARLGGELPPRVALTRPRQGADPEIVVLWTARGSGTSVRLARSTDGGRTFAPPETLQREGVPGDRGWPALALDEHGAAHAIWLDHRGLAPPPGTTPASHKDHRQATEHDGVAMAQKSSLYYASVGVTSPNATSKGSAQLRREHALTPGVCYCCKTALAAGANGTLFAAWRHVYPGNLRDIAFAVSRDGGRSFSAPVRASHDEWAINGCPDDGPAMALDAHGTVHLVWPTVVGGAEPRGAIFYASTRDGRSFTPRQQVPTLGSLKPSHPQIAIDARGRLLVAWDESIEGRRVAAVRALSSRGAPEGNVVRLDAGAAAIYPVVAPIDAGFIAAWTSGAGAQSVIRVRTIESSEQ